MIISKYKRNNARKERHLSRKNQNNQSIYKAAILNKASNHHFHVEINQESKVRNLHLKIYRHLLQKLYFQILNSS
jgi:hypothetical protein